MLVFSLLSQKIQLKTSQRDKQPSCCWNDVFQSFPSPFFPLLFAHCLTQSCWILPPEMGFGIWYHQVLFTWTHSFPYAARSFSNYTKSRAKVSLLNPLDSLSLLFLFYSFFGYHQTINILFPIRFIRSWNNFQWLHLHEFPLLQGTLLSIIVHPWFEINFFNQL